MLFKVNQKYNSISPNYTQGERQGGYIDLNRSSPHWEVKWRGDDISFTGFGTRIDQDEALLEKLDSYMSKKLTGT